jgi:hypothetical protein
VLMDDLAAELDITETRITSLVYHLRLKHGDQAVIAGRQQDTPTGIHEPHNPIRVTLTPTAVEAIRVAVRDGQPAAAMNPPR